MSTMTKIEEIEKRLRRIEERIAVLEERWMAFGYSIYIESERKPQ